jgi:hypothetical protein
MKRITRQEIREKFLSIIRMDFYKYDDYISVDITEDISLFIAGHSRGSRAIIGWSKEKQKIIQLELESDNITVADFRSGEYETRSECFFWKYVFKEIGQERFNIVLDEMLIRII